MGGHPAVIGFKLLCSSGLIPRNASRRLTMLGGTVPHLGARSAKWQAFPPLHWQQSRCLLHLQLANAIPQVPVGVGLLPRPNLQLGAAAGSKDQVIVVPGQPVGVEPQHLQCRDRYRVDLCHLAASWLVFPVHQSVGSGLLRASEADPHHRLHLI